jgi:hypothetical protein
MTKADELREILEGVVHLQAYWPVTGPTFKARCVREVPTDLLAIAKPLSTEILCPLCREHIKL